MPAIEPWADRVSREAGPCHAVLVYVDEEAGWSHVALPVVGQWPACASVTVPHLAASEVD